MSNITHFDSAKTMSSREIADLTGKQHFHVVRDIRAMFRELEIDPEGFIQTWRNPQNGQTYREFLLDQDLTFTLVSGYSAKLRYAVVKRWRELEEGKAQPTAELPKERRTASLHALVDLAGGKREVMERRVDRMVSIGALTLGHMTHMVSKVDLMDLDGEIYDHDWFMTPELALALVVQDKRFFPEKGDQPEHLHQLAVERLGKIRHYLYASALDGREGYSLEAFEADKGRVKEPDNETLAKALSSPKLVELCQLQQEFFDGDIDGIEYQQRLQKVAALPTGSRELLALK